MKCIEATFARTLARRRLLRAGAAVGLLPILELCCNENGTAFADETSFPTIFGLFTWGNGVRPDAWVPALTGAGAGCVPGAASFRT